VSFGVAAIALLLACLGPARAADSVDNPHGEFREDCALCHLPNAWSPVKIGSEFDHSRFGFPLEGAHQDTPCLLCHLTLEFGETTGSQCSDCHQDIHLGELGLDCAGCHSTRDFVDRSEGVRRHRATRFPLTGTHRTVDCAACHPPDGGASMRFVNTPTECSGCHLETWQATTNPDHAAAGMPTDCDRCHGTATWGGGSFDHAITGFPLTGAHRPLECQRCHTDFVFAALPAGCADCHLDDYQVASNPIHAPGFPTDCAQCHGTAAWQPASFDHAATGFALTGAHLAIDCTQCHVGSVYTGTPTDCYSCHVADYDGTTDPPHTGAGFPTDCAACHTTVRWDGATFNHDATTFPLTGQHRTTACTDCHVGGVYTGTPTDCYSCHAADFNATTDPPHSASGFSTDCAACHGTNGWDGASFDHDGQFFPIYSGAHRNRWSSCSECHVNGADYRQFECILCHAHSNQNQVDSDHRGENGYEYTSAGCFRCHPDGRH
jgi:Zn finger protein HypA/HybF involved in hydrogenase expression